MRAMRVKVLAVRTLFMGLDSVRQVPEIRFRIVLLEEILDNEVSLNGMGFGYSRHQHHTGR